MVAFFSFPSPQTDRAVVDFLFSLHADELVLLTFLCYKDDPVSQKAPRLQCRDNMDRWFTCIFTMCESLLFLERILDTRRPLWIERIVLTILFIKLASKRTPPSKTHWFPK